ncbi:MAG: hypothetical protein PHX54_03645 [Lentimicrobiaceae bacterium]|nr:hypothetical protein [Lentimicrobiaceae bacterium]
MKKSLCFLAGLFALLAMMFISPSCTKEEPVDDNPELKLSFSADTVFFDTVFTTIGSASKMFMIYNSTGKRLNISSISLGKGAASPFRINVDGISGTNISDLEIAAGDSAFVIVKVTIDPNQANSPLIANDSIVFNSNGNIQDVKLLAWGQDAYFYRNAILASDYVFEADKPHVIYGYFIVDSLYTLNISAGARVHLHNNATLLVYTDATLKVNGTPDNPVIIQGDRLEDYYRDVPGQWDRIWLYAGSINNEINYAIIKNGKVGVHADTTGNSANPTLRISNTYILNMSYSGILAQGTTLEAANCVIGNCGMHSVALLLGGKYDFRHCTLGNYWRRSFRRETALILNNYYFDNNMNVQLRSLEKAYFGNCVIYGDKDEELTLDRYNEEGVFNYQFDHCLLRTKVTLDEARFPGSIKNEEPWFADPSANLFKPDTIISRLINKGAYHILQGSFIDLSLDLDLTSRIADEAPDIGAYEFKVGTVRRKED